MPRIEARELDGSDTTIDRAAVDALTGRARGWLLTHDDGAYVAAGVGSDRGRA
jgi:hypothetical protein